MQCMRNYGIVGMVLWACSSKGGECHHFTSTVRVSTMSKVWVPIRVNIRIRVSLVLVIGWG